jgi:hypothetical protein
MASTTILLPSASSAIPVPPVQSATAPGQVLVIGSLSTAQDGKYQAVLSSLEGTPVERQMLDRLLDGGEHYARTQ